VAPVPLPSISESASSRLTVGSEKDDKAKCLTQDPTSPASSDVEDPRGLQSARRAFASRTVADS
jgi:hypothetical protein